MATVERFWSGALQYGTADDVRALVALGVPLDEVGEAELMAVNVEEARARRWARAAPLTTRGEVITLTDSRYPPRLSSLVNAPPVLLVEGDPSCLRVEPAVSIVGTRRCSSYGRAVARTLSRALAQAGAVVVSGLARGIDAYAHQGAAEAGRTVAVLGHGLGHTAPASNRALRRTIVEQGGLMVSVWPDEMEPARWTFPKRNEWIAGLAHHVVVVEAPVRSGALITADRAGVLLPVEGVERRPPVVWAVPGQLGAPASQGCFRLLREGARLVTSVDEMVREVTGARSGRSAQPECDWVERLCEGASLDEVARLRGISTLDLLREVSRMELQGVLVRLPGQRYARGGRAP